MRNLSNPVSDNFTAATPFYKAVALPALTPDQYLHFTRATSHFLSMVQAKRAAKQAADIAIRPLILAENTLKRVVDIEEEIVVAKLRNVQRELDTRIGNSCPDIVVDVLGKRLIMKEAINFIGGKAQICVEDMYIVKQLIVVIKTLYEIVGDEEMIHVRVDGHVQDTGKPERCLIISYFRAAEIVRNIAKHIPKKFVHS